MPRLLHTYLVPSVCLAIITFACITYPTQPASSQAAIASTPALTIATTSPVISAPQYLVFNIDTGAVISERNADTVVPIASVTKLFTAAIVAAKYPLTATTTIAWSDLATEGEAGKLAYGEVYSAQELLFPLLLESSNDAATALTRVTQDQLVSDMNTWVRTQGATATQFVDTSGLADANVSTAHELQQLTTAVFKNSPHVFDITTLPEYIGATTGWRNNNPVAGEPGYRGGKHGYTTAANRTLVAIFDEEINGHSYTLGYVLLGSDHLQADLSALRTALEATDVQ